MAKGMGVSHITEALQHCFFTLVAVYILGVTQLTSSFVARSQKTSGIGRLMVHVIEATELKACKPNGKCCFHSTDVVAPCS